MLKIRFKDNKYNAVWLVEPKITIGRSATNALVIDDPLASDVHMEVLVDNEHLTLRNLIPTQPVIVNGQLVTILV
jgi:pSer/pThr/pTyr-binding forkhead associated (FHA) protein